MLFITISVAGQTVSPYSIFGNGDRETGRLVGQQGMGGLSAGLRDPMQLNVSQPASYSSLLYTTISIGGFYQEIQLKDASKTLKTSAGGFNYLTFGFPLAEGLGLSAGLQPYSKVGYNINSRISTSFSDAKVLYSGTGGFDKAYLGLGWEVVKGLSVGVNGNFLFGSTDRLTTVVFDDISFYNVLRNENIAGNGFTWDAGVQYKTNVGRKNDLTVGATYMPSSQFVGSLNDYQASFTQNANGDRIFRDTVYAAQDENVNINFNSSLSLGFTFGGRSERLVQHAWSVGADFQMLNRSELSSSSLLRGEFQNGFRVNVGGQIIPAYAFERDRGGYLSQVDYRLGAYYENSGLVLGGEAINDMGASLGFGFPIGRRSLAPGDVKFAMLNIGMIVGRRGTMVSNNIEETYAKFLVGLTINDKWFTQFKYR